MIRWIDLFLQLDIQELDWERDAIYSDQRGDIFFVTIIWMFNSKDYITIYAILNTA